MKNIIVIFGTIILGVTIVISMIMGDGGLKGGTDKLKENSKSAIDKMTTDTKPLGE